MLVNVHIVMILLALNNAMASIPMYCVHLSGIVHAYIHMHTYICVHCIFSLQVENSVHID